MTGDFLTRGWGQEKIGKFKFLPICLDNLFLQTLECFDHFEVDSSLKKSENYYMKNNQFGHFNKFSLSQGYTEGITFNIVCLKSALGLSSYWYIFQNKFKNYEKIILDSLLIFIIIKNIPWQRGRQISSCKVCSRFPVQHWGGFSSFQWYQLKLRIWT